jgi:hypothetical protein
VTAIVGPDARWAKARDMGLLVTVAELAKGDRFLDAVGNECTYDFADGAGIGATHHARRDDGTKRLIAGWLRVLRL